MKVVEITPFFGVFGQILTREACRSRVSSQFSALHGTRSRLYDHKIPIFTLAKLHHAGTHQKVSETKTQLQLKQGSCAAIMQLVRNYLQRLLLVVVVFVLVVLLLS